jgi:SAM-dependent methyltransferase
MAEIIADYNQRKANKFQNANIELEIRHTKVTQKIFNMYNDYMNKNLKPTIINTINSIHDDIVKTILFEGAIRKSVESGTKKHLSCHDVGNGFKVNISQETVLKYDTISSSNSLVRIKTRKSAPIEIDGVNWRLDITIVKQIVGPEIKNAKDYAKILFEADYDKLASNTKNDPSYNYEAELEFISGKLTENVYRKALSMFKSITNPSSDVDNTTSEYLEYVNKIINKGVLNKYKRQTLTIKSILPNVSSLTKNNYRLIYESMVGFYMTDKAEGIRSLLILKDKKFCIVNSNIVFISTSIPEFDSFVLDGEYIVDKNLFLVFDVVHCADKPFHERIKIANDIVSVISKYTPCIVKTFYKINELSDIKTHYETIMANSAKADYANDGIIFTSSDKDYVNTINYKWKPVEHNTIDFLAKRLPDQYVGTNKYLAKEGLVIHLLFVGITKAQYDSRKMQTCVGYKDIFDISQFTTYMPIQFSTANSPYAYIYYHPKDGAPIDGKIVELFADDISGLSPAWRLVNIREDRDIDLSGGNYFGNNYSVAENVWLNYMDPFPETELWDPSSTYFDTDKKPMYKKLTEFINHVKDISINRFSGSNTIIDIGVGKGQDIRKYAKAKISNLVGIDKDKSALSEFSQRKSKLKTNMKIYLVAHDVNVNAHVPDLEGFKVLKKELEEKYKIVKCNAIVCNLALHYVENIERFVIFCASMLNSSGYVLFTCFSDTAIHTLFETNGIKPGESWKYYEEGVLKYELNRRYSGPVNDENSKIGVLLPFSKDELYEENLINFEFLFKLFTKHGFRLEYSESISESLPKYNLENPEKTLEGVDAEYAGLYYRVLFSKK